MSYTKNDVKDSVNALFSRLADFRILSGNPRLFNCRDESIFRNHVFRTYGCFSFADMIYYVYER